MKEKPFVSWCFVEKTFADCLLSPVKHATSPKFAENTLLIVPETVFPSSFIICSTVQARQDCIVELVLTFVSDDLYQGSPDYDDCFCYGYFG